MIIVPFRPGALPLRYAVIGYRNWTRTSTSRNGFIRGVAAATSRGCAVPLQGGQKAADCGLAAKLWNDKECQDFPECSAVKLRPQSVAVGGIRTRTPLLNVVPTAFVPVIPRTMTSCPGRVL